MTSQAFADNTEPGTHDADLGTVVVPLLKGVIHAESGPELWRDLLTLQARVRDYVRVMGLTLILDEAEGYAFLQSISEDEENDREPAIPRLVARRPLSFPVSLLLALLRKKLAEFDAGGADTRLVLSRDDLVDLMRVFLPETTNDTRLISRVDAHITKIVDLGFLRRLKGEERLFEVRRIIKAFVDAQWLAEFDARLAEYRTHAEEGGQE